MSSKANILVLGTSGAGKSTLINTVIGKEVAKVRSGHHGTEKMEAYVSEELNFQLIDSRGFEYDFWHTKKAVKDMKTWLKNGLKDKQPRIHMLWLCVDATSKRFTKRTIKTVEQVKKEWVDVPMIVVLTKSFFIAEDQDNIEMVRETLKRIDKQTENPIAIIPVLAQAPKGENIVPRGIEELIKITDENLDEAVKASDEAVKRFDLKYKRIKAQTCVVGATISGSTVGAIPLEFPDANILVPIETAMISAITRIYKLDQKNQIIKDIMARIIKLGAMSMIAKTIINKFKLIPGVVNLAGDVLNAIVAGMIISGMGEASIIIMEKVYKGEIDKEDLSWIDDIVSNQMNSILKKVIDFMKQKDGDITLKDILNLLANQKTD